MFEFLWLLAACMTTPLTQLDVAAPPPQPALRVSAVVAGEPVHMGVEVRRGVRVVFLQSDFRPEPAECPPALQGACLDLAAPRILSDVRADGAGHATAVVTVPADADLAGVASFQAVVFLPRGPVPTTAVTLPVLDPARDLDQDGLTAAQEVSAYTDPLRPDSDGGGTTDGQELLYDLTDPRLAADDRHAEADCDDRVDNEGDGLRDCDDPDCGCIEQCTNRIDDDHDGRRDCDDLACAGDPACTERCNNGQDDDGDGAIDCADAACAASASCERQCGDGRDNDGDRRTDCADVNCQGLTPCPLGGEVCHDGVDNDQDGLADCRDPACASAEVCQEDCADGVDNDADGLLDCGDPSCARVAHCAEECADQFDNDEDGRLDCEDSDCRGRCPLELCGDGLDNDHNGRTDCDDDACDDACFELCDDGVNNDGDTAADCHDDACGPGCREACFDGVDNDADGTLDCVDLDCDGRCAEHCHNGIDDDANGAADCADPACPCREDCANSADDDRDGAVDCADSDCAAGCGEVCGNGADDDGDGLVDCEDGSCTDLCVETCGNGTDDDGDAWVDCQDEECWSDPACPEADRVAWVTGGHLRGEVNTNGSHRNPCGQQIITRDQGTATGVRGFIQVNHAGREDVCTWQVDRASFFRRAVDSGYAFALSSTSCAPHHVQTFGMTRAGVRVREGCGVTGTDFLPPELDVDAFNSYSGYFLPARASARLPGGGGIWYGGGEGHGLGFNRVTSGAAFGTYVAASAGPLEPTAAFGTCATGQPTLTPALTLIGGLEGVCAP